MSKLYVKVDGIHCGHCVTTVRLALQALAPVDAVEMQGNIAEVSYHGKLPVKTLVQTIRDAGYMTKPEWVSDDKRNLRSRIRLVEFLLILAGILLLNLILEKALGYNIFSVIPTIDGGITYGMLFVTGIMTSIHCVGMCGAINLAAAAHQGESRRLLRPVLYNLGRVLSYTVTGGLVGALGSVFEMNAGLSGAVILFAGCLMLLMALNMLGVLHCRLPQRFTLCSRSGNAFVIGLLNGLMPCGPLQAMQLYALSAGSPFLGAASMFLFGIGTVPLMLCMGVLSNALSGDRRVFVNRIASVLILVLSVVMLSRGLNTLGIDPAGSMAASAGGAGSYEGYVIAEQYGEYQQVEFDLSYGGYADVVVKAGVPVRMIIHADSGALTGCNQALKCAALGFSASLKAGDNLIEFTPEEGTWMYTCWMSMLKNTIVATAEEEIFEVNA